MNNKFFVYAVFVTIVTTFACWVSLLSSAGNASSGSGRGSSWSSHGGGYGGGSGYGGGGHK